MLCYKGISCSLSRFRFRFATSAVSVYAFIYYVQNKQFFLHFSYIFQKNILTFAPKKTKAYERHSCKSVVIPL